MITTLLRRVSDRGGDSQSKGLKLIPHWEIMSAMLCGRLCLSWGQGYQNK